MTEHVSEKPVLIVLFDSTKTGKDSTGKVFLDRLVHPEDKTAQECANDLLEGTQNIFETYDTVLLIDPETLTVYATATNKE